MHRLAVVVGHVDRGSALEANPNAVDSNEYKLQPELHYGCQIMLKHHATSKSHTSWILHSHLHKCELESSSKQQEVFCRSVKDSDWPESQWQLWEVKPGYSVESRVRGSPVEDRDVIRLQHVRTKSYLHTHQIRAHLTKQGDNQREVTCFDQPNEDDDWIIHKIENVDTKLALKLIHKKTGYSLHSHSVRYPGPVMSGQQEVTAWKHWETPNPDDVWLVEELLDAPEKSNAAFKAAVAIGGLLQCLYYKTNGSWGKVVDKWRRWFLVVIRAKGRRFLFGVILAAATCAAVRKCFGRRSPIPCDIPDDQLYGLRNEEDFRQIKQASKVHIISTPWITNQPAVRKAAATKMFYDNPGAGVYTFNPTTGLKAAAADAGMSQEQQGKLWLKLWTDVAMKVQRTGGTCFIMAKGTGEDDFVLEGNAQQGEKGVAELAKIPIEYVFY